MMDMADMMGAMGWWMALWAAVLIALITLLVAGTVRLLRGRPHGERDLPQGHAEAELRRRYATGEIDHDDYAQRLTILRSR